ncbi:MAG: TIGR01212 family radical SAM protein [Oscillospiraceae bacterium]|nr:TIGR01212 family radical SAM protein [Oscillospiraceae bacterium]
MFYHNYSGWLREHYQGKITKICIDGGFTCPNRDGTCGTGGCIFCGERGAGDHIRLNALSIEEQTTRFIRRNPKSSGFIAYFQNFTNTYAPVDVLKARYDAAMQQERMVALAVGTRPDCITEEIADLLQSYMAKYDVWVELGLQTADDDTALRIHRGYPRAVFTRAVEILNARNIPVVAHIMVGLPGETMEHLERTVAYLNTLKLWGIKIHSVYVMKDTILEKMYLNHEYNSMSMDAYTDCVTYVLTHISPDLIVHRLTGDCPPDELVAPEWNLMKNDIIAEINRKMEMHHWMQGCLYESEGFR